MDQKIKLIADKLIEALKKNKEINNHFNKIMDMDLLSNFAVLFIETIDIQDKNLDLQKEIERVYSELFDFILKKKYRSDILLLVLEQMKINILQDNKALMEITEYIKKNTVG